MGTLAAKLGGHYWTLVPHLRSRLRPTKLPAGEPVQFLTQDADLGALSLTGEMHVKPGADDLVVVVHGLGGGLASDYTRRAAAAALREGFSCLRLAMRGADRRGDDFYHAGLGEDIDAVLRSKALARYERRFLIGYSLGGHVSLQAARHGHANAVAALCAPLDLHLAADHFDSPAMIPYRGHVLSGLKEMVRAIRLRRRPYPLHFGNFEAIHSLREWDRKIVAPRFGFADENAYYDAVAMGARIGELTVPSLIVNTRHDPMVSDGSVNASLIGAASLPNCTVVRLERGGHVGFHPESSLSDHGVGERGPSIESEVMRWFTASRRSK
ncbi:MAG: alpha/beta fold hydrolase [Myxococcota bacterium]